MLVRLRENGDRVAFEELYERHWQSLFDVAFKRLKDRERCKDVAHDVFADLWDRREQSRINDLLPYLHTAVRNKVYNLVSRGQATTHFVEPFENMAVSPQTADGYFDEKELRKLILLFIETLPAKRQKIFRMRYLEDKSTKEISEELQISQKTVQNQLLNAVNELRTNMSSILLLSILIELSKK